MSKKRLTRLITSLVVLLIGTLLVYGGVRSQTSSHASSPADTTELKVLKVVDGDTIELNYLGKRRTVRLIGMDTPETLDPRKPVQCFGREASAQGHKLLENSVVKLEFDDLVGEIDKYGRSLAYVFMPDGTLYNQRMIAEGYAHEYTYNNQHYKYQAAFKAAEAEAKAGAKGFWSPSSCGGDTKQAAQ